MSDQVHSAGGAHIKDSGARREFSTGAHRDRAAGKGAFHLLPWHALLAVAQVFEAGAKKYTKNNYRLGMPLSEYISSGLRHMIKAGQGWNDEPHAAQAAWNMLCFIETKAMIDAGVLPKELDDIENWLTPEGIASALAAIKDANKSAMDARAQQEGKQEVPLIDPAAAAEIRKVTEKMQKENPPGPTVYFRDAQGNRQPMHLISREKRPVNTPVKFRARDPFTFVGGVSTPDSLFVDSLLEGHATIHLQSRNSITGRMMTTSRLLGRDEIPNCLRGDDEGRILNLTTQPISFNGSRGTILLHPGKIYDPVVASYVDDLMKHGAD